MKGSKCICGISVALLFATVMLVASVWAYHRNLLAPGDLQFRYNESLCAHTGVNPFHVWNHDVEVDGFRGLSRPDFAFDADDSKLQVHAYPPWHMTYTWLYGRIPFPYVVGFVFMFYGFSLSALLRVLKRYCPEKDSGFYWTWSLFCLASPIASCFVWGNYGILIAGLLILMISALDRDCQIIAGIAWALMMIKPQMAMLCIFPLLFQKKFIAIAVAVCICSVATLWPAYIYGESPIALIMQIPQIGAPYDTSIIFNKLASQNMKALIKGAWILGCVVLCGYCSWLWRSAKDTFLRFAPVAFVFPLWLYSQGHDLVAAWPWCLLVAFVVIKSPKESWRHKGLMCYLGVLIVSKIFSGAWGICVAFNILDPAGKGWVYHAVEYPVGIMHFMVGCLILLTGPCILEVQNESKTVGSIALAIKSILRPKVTP